MLGFLINFKTFSAGNSLTRMFGHVTFRCLDQMSCGVFSSINLLLLVLSITTFFLRDAQFTCKVASKFKLFLKEQQSNNDMWISTCVNFLETSSDFLGFVTAYRIGDAVAIEYGYQKHPLVW